MAGGEPVTAAAGPVVMTVAVTAVVADDTGDAICEPVGAVAEPVTAEPVAATAVTAAPPATAGAVEPPATNEATAADEAGKASGLTTMELAADAQPVQDAPGNASISLLLLGEATPVSPVRGMCASGPMITI